MPKYYIEMGQGIVVGPGIEVGICTSPLQSCCFIAGYNVVTGRVGAFHYPAGALKRRFEIVGEYEGASVLDYIRDDAHMKNKPVRAAMRSWIADLDPTAAHVIYGPLVRAVEGGLSDRAAEKDIRKVERFVQRRGGVVPTTQCDSSGALVRRVYAGAQRHRSCIVGNRDQVSRIWTDFTTRPSTVLSGYRAGHYGAYTLFGTAEFIHTGYSDAIAP